MWTKEHRARQLAFKQHRRYPTDLTDAEWEGIMPLLPKPAPRGRPPKVDLREILNAIRYMARSGGGWRMRAHTLRAVANWYIGGSGASCAGCCSRPSMTLP